jgi:alpha-D-xyloside xylohydrolase
MRSFLAVLMTVNLTFVFAHRVGATTAASAGGVIVFEAEAADGSVAGSVSHEWITLSSTPGFSGSGYKDTTLDNGSNININWIGTSPELQFGISFPFAGTYRVWVRGFGKDADADSVHAGFHAGATNTASHIALPVTNAWVWSNTRMLSQGSATLSVGAAGTLTFALWMREDGFRADRVLLTTNAGFQATLGNAWHIPSNPESVVSLPSMRVPVSGMQSNTAVAIYSGNQDAGPGGNPGNQTQSNSTIYYRHATNTSWTALPMTFFGAGGNNKYYSGSIPAGTFKPGDTVQYYLRIWYTDHLPTFLYGNDNATFSTELESAAQADPYSYTVQWPLQASGSYIAVSNQVGSAVYEARVFEESGHVSVLGPDLAGNPLATEVDFTPASVTVAGEPHVIGPVLSSAPFGNGLELRQQLASTSIVARLTFPSDGIVRYEVVDWGGLAVDATVVTAASDATEHFYGFGEKFNSFDQAGKKVRMITDDPPGNKGDKSYKVMPWFMSTKGYGFHLDSSAESWFDMRASAADRYVISNLFGALRFNMVWGPKLTDVLTRYTGYAGRAQMSPPWAFAPWFSSDIWRNGGEIRYLVTKHRQLGIPSSALVFDSPWEVSYNDFTWNTTQWGNGGTFETQYYDGFNTVTDMMTFLRTNGWKVICWMTPFINTSSNTEHTNIYGAGGVPGQNTGQSPNYAEGAANNYFVRASVGGPPLVTNWWKGTGSPVDFTNPNAVLWAQKQLSNLVAMSQSGGFNVIGGFKTDDGESGNPPGTYIPKWAVYFDGRTGQEMQNGYATEYHKAIWNVLGTNGILFARSGFTGSQAYSGCWAGDNYPNYTQENGLQSVIVAGNSAAMCGYSTWSHDIGGYQNTNFEADKNDLFRRWTQFGAFTPLMQMHRQINTGNLEQFPWGYGELSLTNYINYTKLHTALFPYIYSYAKEASTNGLPIIRPLVLLNQADPNVYGINHTYMFGNDLLVAPVNTAVSTARNVYMPAGVWHDFFTHQRYVGGSNVVWNNSNVLQMPLFVRDGAIIPMISSNVMTLCDAAYVSNPALVTMDSSLEFIVYPTTNSSFALYDGSGANCQSSGTIVSFSVTSNPRTMSVRFRSAEPAGVERDGVRLPKFTSAVDYEASSLGWRYDAPNQFVHVKLQHGGGTSVIRFSPDSVGDGISDSWRETHFGDQTTTNSLSCATCDADGDGLTNEQEYHAGTGPQNSLNLLRVTSVAPAGADLMVTFDTVVGMKYRIEHRDDLVAGTWLTLTNGVAGTGGSVPINDPGAAALPRRFYRVWLLP